MRSGKYRKAVFIVAYKKTKNLFGKEKIKYLVLKRHLHWKGWEFPKGGAENGEKDLEIIQRELFEEIGQRGFNIKSYNYSGRYKYKERLEDRKGFIGQTFKLFSAEVKDKKIKIDKREHTTYKWMSFKKAMKILTWKNQQKALEIVNKNLFGKRT